MEVSLKGNKNAQSAQKLKWKQKLSIYMEQGIWTDTFYMDNSTAKELEASVITYLLKVNECILE